MKLTEFADTDLSRASIYNSRGAGPSSLSTLANALEKLKMPPPLRPNTSMGFNPDDDSDQSFDSSAQSKDDGAIGRAGNSMQRAATVGADVLGGPSQLSKPAANAVAGRPNLLQRSKSTFPGASGQRTLLSGTGAIMGLGRGRAVHKVSRNPGLPSVMGSPVKGGQPTHADDAPNETDGVQLGEGEHKSIKTSARFPAPEDLELSELMMGGGSTRSREAVDAWKKNASRRASLASQALSQSLSALPTSTPTPISPPAAGLMGPPATPPKREGLRSSSSYYPSSSSSAEASSASKSTVPPGLVTRSAPGKMNGNSGQAKLPTLTALKDCKVFVDIKGTNGEDAGSLFVDMLQGLGARVCSSI